MTTAKSARRVRVGVVGAGLIAQVMHLHYLRELAAEFEVRAVCDLDTSSASACADRYGIPAVFADWRDMLAHPLDAVMVLTSGSHAPIAEAAARAGLHVFVEKPMCFSAAEGRAMTDAADRAGVTLMVGYPKRYDPAYLRLTEEVGLLAEPRLLRVTTFESPPHAYVGHFRLAPRTPLPADVVAALRADSEQRTTAAIGEATEFERQVYQMVLLDTLVHELNAVRGLLGEPTRLDYVSLAMNNVTVMLRFGELPVAIHWIDLPGISRYGMEFAFYGPQRRLRLTFGSPFLRDQPAVLEIEDGVSGTARSWMTTETVGYDSGFKRELLAFHGCITGGGTPVTSGVDGTRDIALCQSLIRSFRDGCAVDDPAGAGERTSG